MKHLRLLCVLAVMAGSAMAQAIPQNEVFWQADTGEMVFTPKFEYSSSTITPENTTTDLEVTLPQTTLEFEYGITEMFSAGALVGYTFGQTAFGNTETDITGLNDIEFFGKGQMEIDSSSSFHYGVGLALGLSDSEIKADETNVSSGRTTFTPYVGYIREIGPGFAGARASYQIHLTPESEVNKTTTPDSENEYEGGAVFSLAGFYEMPMAWGILGFDLTYQSTSERVQTKAAGVGIPDADQNDNFSSITLGVYPTYKVSDMIEVLGRLSYGRFTSDEYLGADIDSTSLINVSVGARIQI